MQKKYNYLLCFLAIFLLLIPLSQVLALETTLPTIPGTTPLPQNPTLPQYINYFFMLAIISAGVIAFFSLVIAGLQMLMSASNPGAISEARERIIGSIVGLALLMFSFIILQTINPQLVTQRPVTLSPVTPNGTYFLRLINPTTTSAVFQNNHGPFGISIAQAAVQFDILPASSSNPTIPEGYTHLAYFCGEDGPANNGPVLDLWLDGENPDARVDFIECRGSAQDVYNGIVDLSQVSVSLVGVESLDWDYEKPGVFFFDEPDCWLGEGYSTKVFTQSGNLPTWIQNNVKSVFIMNGDGPGDPKFGVVLNDSPDLEGACSQPYMNFISEDIDADSNRYLCVNLSSDSACVNPVAQKKQPVTLATFSNFLTPLATIKLATNTNTPCTTVSDCSQVTGETAVCENWLCGYTIDNPCGNGIFENNEECDDGITNGECPLECSNSCAINDCAPPEDNIPDCGDGNPEFGEDCDDGNTEDGDGCSSVCQIEEDDNENAFCGDTTCDADETTENCPEDCQENIDDNGNNNSCPAYNAVSAYIIRGANSISGDPGDGVSFYEDGGPDINPDTGELNSGYRLNGPRYVNLSAGTIGQQFSMDGTNLDWPVTSPDQLLRDYGVSDETGINSNGQDTCEHENYSYPCTKTIDPRGNFLTLLYVQNQLGNRNKTCGFITDLTELREERVDGILIGGGEIYQGYIFPVQP